MLGIFIILYLIYLSPFFSFLFCNIFLVLSSSFFFTFFLWKNYYFYFSQFKYLSLGLFIQFFLFLFLFFCNLFLIFFLVLFFKIIIQKLRKWYFTVVIAILFCFSAMLKISLKSYMFLFIYLIFTIFYYM
jgi:hypothetical protein